VRSTIWYDEGKLVLLRQRTGPTRLRLGMRWFEQCLSLTKMATAWTPLRKGGWCGRKSSSSLKLDKQFPVEPFEAAASQSAVPSPSSYVCVHLSAAGLGVHWLAVSGQVRVADADPAPEEGQRGPEPQRRQSERGRQRQLAMSCSMQQSQASDAPWEFVRKGLRFLKCRSDMYQFELFELLLLLDSDRQFPVKKDLPAEQFEATLSRSTVPPLEYYAACMSHDSATRHGSLSAPLGHDRPPSISSRSAFGWLRGGAVFPS
jgi:hypothetical protein